MYLEATGVVRGVRLLCCWDCVVSGGVGTVVVLGLCG